MEIRNWKTTQIEHEPAPVLTPEILRRELEAVIVQTGKSRVITSFTIAVTSADREEADEYVDARMATYYHGDTTMIQLALTEILRVITEDEKKETTTTLQ